jgi:hypothetical protein
MKTTRSLSLATHYAQLERARPPGLLARAGDGFMSPRVRADMALMDLANLVTKIGKSKGNAFKVKQQGLAPAVQNSVLGHQILELFPGLAWALEAPREVQFDPRIEIIVGAAKARNLLAYRLDDLSQMPFRDPWMAANLLNGFVDEVRHAANTRAFMHRLQRHKDKHSTRLRDLMSYFKQVSTLYPTADVMRLEPRKRLNTFGDCDFVWRYGADLDLGLADWLRQASSAYGDIIVGYAWKIDYEVGDGFFGHVVLVVDGPQHAEFQGIERALGESWRSIFGPAAYIENCKGPAIELEYRGRRTETWSYALHEELRDAAIFLASTDSLFAWDFDGKASSHGRGQIPRSKVSPRGKRTHGASVSQERPEMD